MPELLKSPVSSLILDNEYKFQKVISELEEEWKQPSGLFTRFVEKNKVPLFSLFTRNIETKHDSRDVILNVLYLKSDGTKYQRNANANPIEVYCNNYFYGPLIAVYTFSQGNVRFLNFTLDDLKVNLVEYNKLEN